MGKKKASPKPDPKIPPIVLKLIGVGFMFAGVVLVIAPFIIGLFNNDDDVPDDNQQQQEQEQEQDQDDEQQSLAGEDGTLEESESTTESANAATEAAIRKSDENIERMKHAMRWIATDYAPGDIHPGRYEVRKGDTLWEISEAVYSNGFLWGKILNRNFDQIGYLPDGSHALIWPGQTLIVPELDDEIK